MDGPPRGGGPSRGPLRHHAAARADRLRPRLRTGGSRSRHAVHPRHGDAHLFHDQAADLGGGDATLRAGPVPARRSGRAVPPRIRRDARGRRRQPCEDRDRTGPPGHHRPRPPHPHGRADLRLHGGDAGRCRLPGEGDRLPRPGGHAGRDDGAHRRDAASRPAGQRLELQRGHRRAGSSRGGPVGTSLRRLPAGGGDRAARHGRHGFPCPAGPDAAISAPATSTTGSANSGATTIRSRRPMRSPPPSPPAAAASSRRRATTTASAG